MALQTFTAGQVLTAAQVNALQANDYNQTVSTKTDSYTLVAADKGTRVEMNKATATTITVNTNLFNAGDTLWIQNIGAGVCTITAGTATVTTANSLILTQNAGGFLYFTSTGAAIFFGSASGLTLINSTTFSGASVQVSNVFTTAFDTYRILINGLAVATTSNALRMQLTIAGTPTAGTGYGTGVMNITFGGTSGSTGIGSTTKFYMGEVATTSRDLVIDIQRPALATNKTISINGTTNGGAFNGAGLLTSSAAHDGFLITNDLSQTLSGTVRVYGYRNA
jgi:hypothetical protein